jgi:hypothetical protein
MAQFDCDHPYLEKEYPYSYIRPTRKYTLLSEEEIQLELEKYIPENPPILHDCKLSVVSLQPSISETFVGLQVSLNGCDDG